MARSSSLYGGKVEQARGLTADEWNDGKVEERGPLILPLANLKEGALRMHLARPVEDRPDTPKMIRARAAEEQRQRSDAAQRQRLMGALDPKLRKALETAIAELETNERALAEARADRAALDAERPTNKQQVEALSDRYVRLDAMIAQYIRLTDGARKVYEQVAASALAEARTRAKVFLRAAHDQHERDMQEIHRQEAEITKRRIVFNEQRDSVCRLQSLVANGDIDIFRDVLR